MKHRIEILAACAILAGLGLATWLLVSGPLAHLFRSTAESYFGMLTIMIVCISLVTGTVVGAWDASLEAPRKHLHHRLRPLLHH
ncbi:MAG: hypothetical protein WA354_11400 [Terracidiphilus sp.]